MLGWNGPQIHLNIFAERKTAQTLIANGNITLFGSNARENEKWHLISGQIHPYPEKKDITVL